MRIGRLGWSAQTWAAVAATAAAGFALFVSVDQAIQSRMHNRLSVRPYLVFSELYLPNQDQGLYITNHGLGPAFVDEVEIYVAKERIYDDGAGTWSLAVERLKQLDPELSKLKNLKVYWLSSGAVISPGKELLAIGVDAAIVDVEVQRTLQYAMKSLGVKIRYRSLYNDRLIGAVGPVPIGSSERVENYRE